MNKRKLLIVDDNIINLQLLKKILEDDYDILMAKSAQEALKHATEDIDLILLDIMLPGMDGYEVCRRLKADERTKETSVIFISAMGEEDDETKGFELGAVDYITKPVSPTIVKARVKTHLNLKVAKERLNDQKRNLEEKVRERTEELQKTKLEIVYRLGLAAEYKDSETGSHIRRMSHYCFLLGKAYGLDEYDCELLLQASPMHDIGKIGIPDNILLKPGKLDKKEWEIMKTHTTIGARILSGSKSKLLNIAKDIAIYHHEKWNGSGYPAGLSGESIPLWGRIVAVADVFDALTSKRPYKDAWPIDRGVEEIIREKGMHFEPRLVELFIRVLPRLLEIKERFKEEPTLTL